MSVCMFLLLAVVGMAFDLGRVYIARNEAPKSFRVVHELPRNSVGKMAAAKQLDGTAEGLDRARAAVTALPNRWNLGTQDFSGVVIEFGADGKQWEMEPKNLKTLHYARVTAPDNHITIMFLRAVGGPPSLTVPARAVASTNPVRLTE